MKNIYWAIVAAVIILGLIMPQEGKPRKTYIIIMAMLHTFVSGFRYKYLTGDLTKYNVEFYDVQFFDYFSERVFQDGKNTGFMWLMKFISDTTNSNFQFFLFFVAVVIEVAVAIIIYRYSPKPWLSYLVWNCIGFYIFGFSAVKQSLAMALVLLAMVYVLENNLRLFLVFACLAGFVHMPAFAFLPAYWLAKLKINMKTIVSYITAAVIIFILRNPIVTFMTDLYYEEDTIALTETTKLGGRFFMIVLILLCGIMLKGFTDNRFEKVFHMIVVAAIFQMFSGFSNVFTRFADYYLQFAILYIPMLFCNQNKDARLASSNYGAILRFNNRSLRIFVICVTAILIWYYYYTCLGATISSSVDNYLNFRFMWDVVS